MPSIINTIQLNEKKEVAKERRPSAESQKSKDLQVPGRKKKSHSLLGDNMWSLCRANHHLINNRVIPFLENRRSPPQTSNHIRIPQAAGVCVRMCSMVCPASLSAYTKIFLLRTLIITFCGGTIISPIIRLGGRSLIGWIS